MKMQLSNIQNLIRPAKLALIGRKKASANSAKIIVRHEMAEVRRYNETFKCNRIVENSVFIHIGKWGDNDTKVNAIVTSSFKTGSFEKGTSKPPKKLYYLATKSN